MKSLPTLCISSILDPLLGLAMHGSPFAFISSRRPFGICVQQSHFLGVLFKLRVGFEGSVRVLCLLDAINE